MNIHPENNGLEHVGTGRRRLERAGEGFRAVDVTEFPGHDIRRAPVLREGDLMRYVRVVRRRSRLGLLIFLVVAGGVAVGSLMQPEVYRATGLMEIRQGADAVPLEALFSSQRVAIDDLETQFGILRSEALAERVVASLGDSGPTSGAGAKTASDAAKSQPISVERFRKNLTVDPQRGSRLVEVSFDAETPELAARVVNSVFDSYLQLRMEEAQRSAEWLQTQLDATQQRLQNTETQLQTYVKQQGLEVLETGQGEMAREVNDRLRFLSESLAAARAARFEKQSEFEVAPTASREVSGPLAETLSARLADLRRERAKLTSAFHEGYPAVKALNSQIAELESELDKEASRAVNRVQREYQAAVRREALLRSALDQQSAAAQAIGQNSVGYQALKREVVTNQQLFTLLNQKLKEVSISAALKASNVGIVDRPRPPRKAYGSPLEVNITLGILVGLLLAIGAVFVREHTDTSVRSMVDIDSYLGVPTLASIPRVAAPRQLPPGTVVGPRGPWRRIDREGQGATPLSEAFAALRTAVLLDDDGQAQRVLLITSAQSEEGKTTVSINLALSLARLNNRVLLIDANMRYPCVQEAFGLHDELGLIGCLTMPEVYWGAFVSKSVRPQLDVLVCGVPQQSPADLLSLPRMRQIISEASAEYDYIVLDSPALLAHPADVRSLASLSDHVLLTVRQGTTPREAVSMALSQLERVSGVVLNHLDSRDIPAHYRDVAASSPV
jgi:polysaccharide biosynthesis transport protein